MEFLKKNGIIIIIVVVLIAILIAFFWKNISKNVLKLTKKMTKKMKKDEDDYPKDNDKDSKAVFVFFKMDNCKFCKEMKSEWEKLKKKGSYNGCKFAEYTAEENKEIISKHKIYSFPTLKLCKEGVHKVKDCIEFEGKRTAQSIISFIDENL